MSCPQYEYTVKSGDVLSRIGSRFGLPWTEVYEANRDLIGPNPSLIQPGQELVIPGRCAEVDDHPGYVRVTGYEPVPGDEDNTQHSWRRSGSIKFLIVHDPVARTVEGLLRYLQWNSRRVSYHDVVVPPGAPGDLPKVHVLVNGADRAVGHAGFGNARDAITGRRFGRAGTNLNEVSWGICIYKHRNDEGSFPPDLLLGSVRLIADRAQQFGVPVPNILGHGEVDPLRRRDPRGLSMDRVRAAVAELI